MVLVYASAVSYALLFKIPFVQLTSVPEQHMVMKCLVSEGSKYTEIHRLSCVFGTDCSMFEWCKCFREGQESIEDDPCEGQPNVSL